MGLTNVLAMFMKTIFHKQNLFLDMLDKGIVFLDDVLIYSTIVEEYFKLLEKVFSCL